jgi:hypothetical protein
MIFQAICTLVHMNAVPKQKNIRSCMAFLIKSACLYPCLIYPACKAHLFLCSTLLSRVACLAPSYFPTLSYKRHGFRKKKKLLNIKTSFDFLYNFCLKRFLFEEEFSEISQMHTYLVVKHPLFLSDFNQTRIFSTIFRKIHKYQISCTPFQ